MLVGCTANQFMTPKGFAFVSREIFFFFSHNDWRIVRSILQNVVEINLGDMWTQVVANFRELICLCRLTNMPTCVEHCIIRNIHDRSVRSEN
ncbi:hypothetical protein PUN28_004692 [Cardiocondyla obscurior]|uniref:Uncharacterized protein n=1 Tax=Cardiocondyla obscurior TaxID=286306 RepID=A0AAW2GEX0_9HYME